MIPQKPSAAPPSAMALTLHSLVSERPLKLESSLPTFLFAMNAAVVRLALGNLELLLDRANWLVLPAGVRAAVAVDLPGARLLTLQVQDPLRDRVAATYQPIGLLRERLDRWLSSPQLLPRTVWVHEVCHRYLFERYTLSEPDSVATWFLETELLKEFYYLCRDREEGVERAAMVNRHSSILERALAVVEAEIFESLPVGELARRCGVSESTLLRAFKRELNCTPGAYARVRRLDEALAMLRAGCFSISEVASRVGYDNPTSFSHAFLLRFGRLPSSFLRRQSVRTRSKRAGEAQRSC